MKKQEFKIGFGENGESDSESEIIIHDSFKKGFRTLTVKENGKIYYQQTIHISLIPSTKLRHYYMEWKLPISTVGKIWKFPSDRFCFCCIFATSISNGMETDFISKKKNGIYDIKVSVVQFKEDDAVIVYCPALDLSGYGYSDAEAQDSFKTVLLEFIRYASNKGTLDQDLQAHGWYRYPKKSFEMVPPSMTDLLASNENFRQIFNTQPSYQKYDMPMMQVAMS